MQGQINVTPWRCTPIYHIQCPYQVSTSYTLWFLRYNPDKLFPFLKVKVTVARLKFKTKVIPLCCTPTTPNLCPYQVSTSDTLSFLKYSPDKIFKLKVTTARSNQEHHAMGENNTCTVLQGCRIKKTTQVFRDNNWIYYNSSQSVSKYNCGRT